MLVDKLKIEFLGTFAITYLSGLSLVAIFSGEATKTSGAISNFAVYSLLLWVGKAISGSHYNPVITISLAISKHIKLSTALVYILFHFIASIFAISLIKISLPMKLISLLKKDTIVGFPLLSVDPLKGIALEATGTLFIVLVYYVLILERNAPKYVYGVGISGMFLVNMILLHDKTGCSLNPMKNLCYAIIGQNYSHLYVYILGPLIGGIIGGLLGNVLLSEKAEKHKKRKKTQKMKRKEIELKKRLSK